MKSRITYFIKLGMIMPLVFCLIELQAQTTISSWVGNSALN